MKAFTLFVPAVLFLAACDAKVTVPASGPTVEKKVEHNTTVVNPPAEKKVETNTTIVTPAPDKK